jgi:hypothetical protein
MARTSVELTQQEIDAFTKFCSEHHINTEGEAGRANGDLMGEYIAITWGEDITPKTLAVALEKLRDRIIFYTPAQWKYKQIADENTTRANTLNNWFHSPGNTSLAKNGEENYQNQAALLAELRGREITPKNIQDAVGRAGFKSGLHYVPTPRTVDPRQHTPSGSFMPKSESNLSAREHTRRTAEAADKAAGRSKPTSGPDYRQLCEDLRGRNHSHTEQLRKMFVTNGSEVDYEQTYYKRRKMAGL